MTKPKKRMGRPPGGKYTGGTVSFMVSEELLTDLHAHARIHGLPGPNQAARAILEAWRAGRRP